MRILDLGAHDGYITNWLGRKLRDHGHQVEVDGIELNPQAIEVARQRAARDGLPGRYEIGLAEDAPDIFEPGSYDAVIAFELIEHVPKVDDFLIACERMVKPGGRVYLSTPDGTFGSGQNPHHLRVYRSIDLFELIRRRGKVEDMLIGHDGVTVISYTPAVTPPQGEVAIYCGPGWEQWSPVDIERKGLGGSETAATMLAVALSDRGWTVTVYGECESSMFRQVVFRHHSAFDPLTPRDLCIVSRTPQLFDRRINSTVKVLWMHDTDYGPHMTDERLVHAAAVMTLSRWHSVHVKSTYPFLSDDKLVQTSNGLNPDRFPIDLIPPRADRPHRAIYSSSPDRGLDLVLDLWPDVRKRVPDAELVYCYSSVYDKIAEKDAQVGAFRDRCRKLADQPGVTNLGSLDQNALAGAMAKARAWLAPSFNTVHQVPFMETYCIGAIEAAAAGCALVMSDWGALPERADQAEAWQLVAPPLGTADDLAERRWPAECIDRKKWVDAIVAALTDEMVIEPSKAALETTWARVAKDFEAVYYDNASGGYRPVATLGHFAIPR